MSALIEIEEVTKVYRLGAVEVPALRGVSFRVERGEVLAIMGPSGSGKSSLLNIVGCLDKPSSGRYRLEGTDVASLGDEALAVVRNQKIGFVFQTFNLLPRASAFANVELPLMYSKQDGSAKERVKAALESVGLGDRIHHRPNELSGGEQQRVAIARALINNPSLLLADEPTGNLDSMTGQEILELLLAMNRARGLTLVLVTHDAGVAAKAGRILRLKDGLIDSGGGTAPGPVAGGVS